MMYGAAPKSHFNTKYLRLAMLVAAFTGFTPPTGMAGQTEGDYLYRVTTVRAAPGHFNDLLTAFRESFQVDRQAGDTPPFLMRHSQGDQWDFMLIYPMGGWSAYYGADRVQRRASAWNGNRGQDLSTRLAAYTSYQEEWFSRSVPLNEMTRRFAGMNLFHVEMFAGLPGARDELLEQRRMENRFYQHLNRQQNVILTRASGTNWDAMTIGFHESLLTFAQAGVQYTEAEQDTAARRAGFDGVGSIGPYLRSLLSYHHDTLGVSVP